MDKSCSVGINDWGGDLCPVRMEVPPDVSGVDSLHWTLRDSRRPSAAKPMHLQVIRRTALFPGAALGAFIIALFAPLAALNSQRLRRILLAITVLNIPFPVEVHLGFREEVGALGSVSGFQISLTTIALPLLYAPLLLNPDAIHRAMLNVTFKRVFRFVFIC